MMNKKGQQVGSTVQLAGTVLVFLLTLAVVAIAIFLALPALTDTTVIPQKRIDNLDTFTNETKQLNSSVGLLPAATVGFSGVQYRDIVMINESGGEIIEEAGNWTFDNNLFVAADSAYNGTNVNVSGGWTFLVDSDAVLVANNVTTGTTDFFNDTPTIMSILGAVVIIAAIVLILLAVSRFELFNRRGI